MDDSLHQINKDYKCSSASFAVLYTTCNWSSSWVCVWFLMSTSCLQHFCSSSVQLGHRSHWFFMAEQTTGQNHIQFKFVFFCLVLHTHRMWMFQVDVICVVGAIRRMYSVFWVLSEIDCLNFCLSVSLSLCLSLFLSVCLFVSFCFFVFLSLSLSVCLSVF